MAGARAVFRCTSPVARFPGSRGPHWGQGTGDWRPATGDRRPAIYICSGAVNPRSSRTPAITLFAASTSHNLA